MRIHILHLLAFAAIAVLVGNAPLRAEEQIDDSADVDSADVDQWILQLADPRFAVRREASHQLSARGVAAIPQVARAVSQKNREVAQRALDVLSHCASSKDRATASAARRTLIELAQRC